MSTCEQPGHLPGTTRAAVVDGVPREVVVVRVRGERAYVKYEDAALYRCAWVPTEALLDA